MNERNDERKGKRTKREKTILKERIEESGAAASLTKIVVLRAFSYGKRSFHASSRTLLSQISPFQRERKGKLPFLSSTTRFTILSFHASSPRAEKRLWGLADRSAPAQIKLSRHRIFNGRSLMYEGERFNRITPCLTSAPTFLSFPIPRTYVYIVSPAKHARSTRIYRRFIKLRPIYFRHFQRCSRPWRIRDSLTRWILIETIAFLIFSFLFPFVRRINTRVQAELDLNRESGIENTRSRIPHVIPRPIPNSNRLDKKITVQVFLPLDFSSSCACIASGGGRIEERTFPCRGVY